MNGQWFVKRGDKARGPFTAERLKELAAEGKLKPIDLLREEAKRQLGLTQRVVMEAAE